MIFRGATDWSTVSRTGWSGISASLVVDVSATGGGVAETGLSFVTAGVDVPAAGVSGTSFFVAVSFAGMSFAGMSFVGVSFVGVSFGGLSFAGVSFAGVSFAGVPGVGVSGEVTGGTRSVSTVPVAGMFFSGCCFGAGGSFGVVVVAGRFLVTVAFGGPVRGSERAVRFSGMARRVVSALGEVLFSGIGMVLVASDRGLVTGGSRLAVLAVGFEAVRGPPSVSQPGFVPGCGPVRPASCLAT